MIGALNGSGAKATDPAELVFRCKKEVEFNTIIRAS
jgi:hypothetical protein